MARSVWRGNITVGLVNIPISLQNTVKDSRKDINNDIHNITPCCDARVSRVDKCQKCGKEVPSREMKKGYEVNKGQYVLMTQEERNSAKLKSENVLEIVNFIPRTIADLDLKLERNYYILPQEKLEKPYNLLVELLNLTGAFALTRITVKGFERTAIIRARGGNLILTTFYYDDEVNPIPEIPPTAISERERELGLQLLDNLKAEKVEWSEFKNRYVEAMLAVINAKLMGQPLPEVKVEAAPAMDLAQALMVSVQQRKKKKVEA